MLLLILLGAGLSGCEEALLPAPEAGVSASQPHAPSAVRAGFITDADLLFEEVAFRSDAHADIHVRLFVNESMPCRDPHRTAFAIHGINHTAAAWERLAEVFFQGSRREQLCLVAAIDMPGHGQSSLPAGNVFFGALMLEDYARTVSEVLDRLARQDIRPAILIGHSQGTQTIQLLQQTLLEGGTNLRERFGIRDAVLLGAQGPQEAPNTLPLPMELIDDLLLEDAEKGTFIQGPAPVFQQLWFVNLYGKPSSQTPPLEMIAASGWNADVPLYAMMQTAGLGGFERPSVGAGIFGPASGTRVQMVDFADDPWSLTPEAQAIYEHLTGDASRSGFVVVTDTAGEAVHDYMITVPEAVRAAVALPRAQPAQTQRAAR